MTTRLITPDLVGSWLPVREEDSHKGTYGKLLAVCGSYGMAGAALLCVGGALRSGAGLVTGAVPASVYPLIAAARPEAMFLPLPEVEGQLSIAAVSPVREAASSATAIVAGCGLRQGEGQRAVLSALLRCGRPLVLDADGINGISPHILKEEAVCTSLILTPHPGEMARLLDVSTEQLAQHRREIVRRFADEYGVTLVLKGHRTLVAAPDRPLLENPTGNPGMATGGSGDVLAGVIGGLLAQGLAPYEAAACGVYIHGAAGDRGAARLSMHSLLPSDLIEELGAVFLQFEK